MRLGVSCDRKVGVGKAGLFVSPSHLPGVLLTLQIC
jgi:hypothetical protein